MGPAPVTPKAGNVMGAMEMCPGDAEGTKRAPEPRHLQGPCSPRHRSLQF